MSTDNTKISEPIQTFKFNIYPLVTHRQDGQVANVTVSCKYRDENYINYVTGPRQVVLDVFNDPKLDPDTFWEVIAKKICISIYAKYIKNFVGVKVQIIIQAQSESTNMEPGDHGPICKIGDTSDL